MTIVRLEYFAVYLLIAGPTIAGLTYADESCLDSLPDFRSKAEAFFLDPESSPFDDEYQAIFSGFTYFDDDESYCVDAKYDLSNNTQTVEFPTFNKETIPFREHGVFRFEIAGNTLALTAFQRMDLPEGRRQWVLVAFRDLTNGKETYGGGRYLEINLPIDSTTILDFNRAANPFCAYQPDFACPMPPIENWLKLRIPVGELNYVGDKEGDT